MDVIVAILKQQLVGVIRLSFPILMIALSRPDFLQTYLGQIGCSLFIGFYVFYMQYRATRKQASILQFSPSGACKEEFEKYSRECKLDPSSVIVRYGYCGEGIALTMFNTISIDPLMWGDLIDRDAEALKVKNILDQHIVPTLSLAQKNKIAAIKEILLLPAQRFIFKHEVGHVFYNYSYKKLALTLAIGAFSTYSGLAVGAFLYAHHFFPYGACIIGMLFGGFVDLCLSYSSNLFFKAVEEKKADLFAVKHSSAEDIAAAAIFFEKHQAILDCYKEPSVLARVPSVILTGHYNGRKRAAYLRRAVEQKSIETSLA